MALPEILQDLLRGGLPEVLDLPTGSSNGQFSNAPFPERFAPHDTAALPPAGSVNAGGSGFQVPNVAIVGGLALIGVIAAAAILKG